MGDICYRVDSKEDMRNCVKRILDWIHLVEKEAKTKLAPLAPINLLQGQHDYDSTIMIDGKEHYLKDAIEYLLSVCEENECSLAETNLTSSIDKVGLRKACLEDALEEFSKAFGNIDYSSVDLQKIKESLERFLKA